jgi:hypothetical protein
VSTQRSPADRGESQAPRPEQDWIEVPILPVVSEEIFAQVQAKLDTNQQGAARNTRHEYLLRAGQLRRVPAGVHRPPGRISGRGSTAGRRGSSLLRLSAPSAASATHAAA